MKLDAHFQLARGGFDLDARLELEWTGVVALFGPSGSGKTTFLRCMAGLERPLNGHLIFGQRRWLETAQGHCTPPYGRSVGVVFQDGRLFDHLSVLDNLQYGWQRLPISRRKIGVDEVVELLELTPLLARWPQGLSGGERQRVAMGRALLTSPDLLLMDEPVASLDAVGKRRVLDCIRRLQRRYGLPMIYVSHDMGEIMVLADQLAWMKDGRILAVGPLGEMVTRLDLPLAHTPDAGAVVEAFSVGLDREFHLTHLAFGQPSQLLSVAGDSLAVGEAVRIWVNARDVSLVLDLPGRTSILNVFPARIVELVAQNRAQVMVKVEVGGVFLLARVTQRSRHLLALAVGMVVFVQVKSVALVS